MEVSVVRAMARRAGRLAERRTTNSATRCWAAAAEPPLPATRSLRPACMALAVSSAIVAMVSAMWRSARVACMVAMDWASCFWTRCFMEWGDSRVLGSSDFARVRDVGWEVEGVVQGGIEVVIGGEVLVWPRRVED